MNFAKIYPSASLPTSEDGYTLIVSSPHDFDIPANHIYNIKLKLMLLTLPPNSMLKLRTLNPFKILIKFWLPSCNELTIPVITSKPLHINQGETLCHLQLVSITNLLPGKKKTSNFIIFKKNATSFFIASLFPRTRVSSQKNTLLR